MDAPARYVARKLDPNTLAIRDTNNNDLYLMYVIQIVDPYANYQITISKAQENKNLYMLLERETFSTKVFCSTPSVLQALVRSMLSFMDEGFELSSPSEFAFQLGGFINNHLPSPPKRRNGVH